MTRAMPGWLSLPNGCAVMFACLMASIASHAQTADFKLSAIYECPGSSWFKVLACAGPADADWCDVEAAVRGQPPQRGKSTRQQIMLLLPQCQLQTAAGNAGPASPATPQADRNGFKIGETVNVSTAGGWTNARILRADGDSYLVQVGAYEVVKTYPSELRRTGVLTDVDRARGLFALHDTVQVNVEGGWVEGEIISELGLEYQVQLVDHRTAWASAQNLRRVAKPDKVLPKAGEPPRRGLKSCAGKFEGRYASTGGGAASLQITFRAGKATLSGLGGGDEFECWTDGTKIYLHTPGTAADGDMPIDLNDDGTLETPFGEIKKKGK